MSSNFYIIGCELPVDANGAACMEIHNHFEVGSVWSWESGKKFSQEECEFPLPIEINYEPFRGYQGPPRELVDVGIPIMSSRLAAALQSAGVTNVESFPCVLKNTVTGETHDYRAFNVVGLVAAADLKLSAWSSADGKLESDVSFDSLALDESKIKASGLRMFRLAENINALVIHKSVRDQILKSGINTLQFTAPEDWTQI